MEDAAYYSQLGLPSRRHQGRRADSRDKSGADNAAKLGRLRDLLHPRGTSPMADVQDQSPIAGGPGYQSFAKEVSDQNTQHETYQQQDAVASDKLGSMHCGEAEREAKEQQRQQWGDPSTPGVALRRDVPSYSESQREYSAGDRGPDSRQSGLMAEQQGYGHTEPQQQQGHSSGGFHMQTPIGGGVNSSSQLGFSGEGHSFGGPITPEIADGALGEFRPSLSESEDEVDWVPQGEDAGHEGVQGKGKGTGEMMDPEAFPTGDGEGDEQKPQGKMRLSLGEELDAFQGYTGEVQTPSRSANWQAHTGADPHLAAYPEGMGSSSKDNSWAQSRASGTPGSDRAPGGLTAEVEGGSTSRERWSESRVGVEAAAGYASGVPEGLAAAPPGARLIFDEMVASDEEAGKGEGRGVKGDVSEAEDYDSRAGYGNGDGEGLLSGGSLSSHHEAAAQNACRFSAGGSGEESDGAVTDAVVTEAESDADSYAFSTRNPANACKAPAATGNGFSNADMTEGESDAESYAFTPAPNQSLARPHVPGASAVDSGPPATATKAMAPGEVQASKGWFGARLQYGDGEDSGIEAEWDDVPGASRPPRQYGLNLDTDTEAEDGPEWPRQVAAPGLLLEEDDEEEVREREGGRGVMEMARQAPAGSAAGAPTAAPRQLSPAGQHQQVSGTDLEGKGVGEVKGGEEEKEMGIPSWGDLVLETETEAESAAETEGYTTGTSVGGRARGPAGAGASGLWRPTGQGHSPHSSTTSLPRIGPSEGGAAGGVPGSSGRGAGHVGTPGVPRASGGGGIGGMSLMLADSDEEGEGEGGEGGGEGEGGGLGGSGKKTHEGEAKRVPSPPFPCSPLLSVRLWCASGTPCPWGTDASHAHPLLKDIQSLHS